MSVISGQAHAEGDPSGDTQATDPEDGRTSHCKCSSNGRNLVVCIDGTSNRFGPKTTNVIELYNLMDKSEQPTYYSSGIGTYAKVSLKTPWSAMKQAVHYTIDLAIAWNFEGIVMAAYRWLCENYKDNDRIYLFGFSRGAYQARALAGMIHKVGLLHKGNERQIPFAYELYADPTSEKHYSPLSINKRVRFLLSRWSKSKGKQDGKAQDMPGDEMQEPPDQGIHEKMKNIPINLAQRFKTAFSRENVRVHFIGVWDTVSSIGVIRGKTLPLTDTASHVCFFRHALALDECRVKFSPEYALWDVRLKERQSQEGELSPTPDGIEVPDFEVERIPPPAHIKEVWFRGTHSDIGGGNEGNFDLNLRKPPFMWMAHEAISRGLVLKLDKVGWDPKELNNARKNYSMPLTWRLTEWLPVKRPSYKSKNSTTRWPLHKGQGRKIMPGQKIHASVAFTPILELAGSNSEGSSGAVFLALPFRRKVKESLPKGYFPKAILPGSAHMWEALVKSGWDWQKIGERHEIFEMNIFHPGLAKDVVQELSSESCKDVDIWLQRLEALTWSYEGCESLTRGNNAVRRLATLLDNSNPKPEIQRRAAGVMGTLRGRGFLTDRDDCVVEGLITACHAEDGRTTRIAARVLGQFSYIFSFKLLFYWRHNDNPEKYVDWLGDGNSETVREALQALCGLRRHSGPAGRLIRHLRPIIRKKLEDANKDVRAEAMRYLIAASAEFSEFELGISLILGKLDDSDKEVKVEVVRLLTLCASDDDLCNQYFDSDTMLSVVKHLDDSNRDVRAEVVRFMATFARDGSLWARVFDDAMISTLKTRLESSHCSKRDVLNILSFVPQQKDEGTCLILGKIFSDTTLREILDMLGDSDDEVREEAMRLLAVAVKDKELYTRLSDVDAAARMVSAAQRTLSAPDGHWHIRREALKMLRVAAELESVDLQELFNKRMIKAIRRRLDDDDEDVRVEAVRLLAVAATNRTLGQRIFVSSTILAVQGKLNDVDDVVAEETVRLLLRVTRTPVCEVVFNADLTRALQSKLSDRHWEVGPATLQLLGELVKDRMEDRKAKKIAPGDSDNLRRVPGGTQWLAPPANHQDIWARLFDGETISAWIHKLNDSQWKLRRQALNLLIVFASDEDIRELILTDDKLSAMRNALNDPDEEVRMEAVRWLDSAAKDDHLSKRVFDSDTILAIQGKLRDNQRRVRQETLKMLAVVVRSQGFWELILSDDMLSSIRKALEDPDEEVRMEAIRWLDVAAENDNLAARVFDSNTILAIQEKLHDRNWHIRQETLKMLAVAVQSQDVRGLILNDGMLLAIRMSLVDSDPDVGKKAIEWLKQDDDLSKRVYDFQIMQAAQEKLCDERSDIRSKALKLLAVEMRSDDIRELILNAGALSAIRKALNDEDEDVRVEAVRWLAIAAEYDDLAQRVFDADTILAVQEKLRDDDWRVRQETIKMLAIAVRSQGVQKLILNDDLLLSIRMSLEDSDPDVREEATEWLKQNDDLSKKVHNFQIIRAAQERLCDDAGNVRSEALKILAVAVQYEGVQTLNFDRNMLLAVRKALGDSNRDIRVETMRWLGTAAAHDHLAEQVFKKDTVLAVQEKLHDDFWRVRQETLKMLAIAVQSLDLRKCILDDDMLSAIRKALIDDDEEVRVEALRWLAVAAKYNDLTQRVFHTHTISALHDKLRDDDSGVRQETLKMLAVAVQYQDVQTLIFNHDMLSAIHKALGDSNEDVRVEALRWLASAAKDGVLVRRVFNADTIAVVQEKLRDSNWHIRQETLKMLAIAAQSLDVQKLIFKDSILLAIRKALEDSDEDVRVEALRWLAIAAKNDGLRPQAFHAHTILAIQEKLRDDGWHVRQETLKMLTITVQYQDVRTPIFDRNMLLAIRKALSDSHENVRIEALRWLAIAAKDDHLAKRAFDTETALAIQERLRDNSGPVRLETLKMLAVAIRSNDIREQVLNDGILKAIRKTLDDSDTDVREEATQWLKEDDELSNRVLDDQTIQDSKARLCSPEWFIRLKALKLLAVAVQSKNVRGRILLDATLSAIRMTLEDSAEDVRLEALRWLTISVKDDHLAKYVFDADTILAVGKKLRDYNWRIRQETLKMLAVAVQSLNVRKLIFTHDVLLAIRKTLDDPDEDIRLEAIRWLANAVEYNDFTQRVFNARTILALQEKLRDDDSGIRQETLRMLAVAVEYQDVRTLIYNQDMLLAIRKVFSDSNEGVRAEAMKWLIAATKDDNLHSRILDPPTIEAVRNNLDSLDAANRADVERFLPPIPLPDEALSSV